MKNKYLKDGRLSEVLALIQVLAYDKFTSRSESALAGELQSKPSSSLSWVLLANEHSEFFRVRNNEDDVKEDRVSLVSRFVLPSSGPERLKSPLDANTVNKLMEIAIEIHDRQVERRDRWKLYTPIILAVFEAVIKIIFG